MLMEMVNSASEHMHCCKCSLDLQSPNERVVETFTNPINFCSLCLLYLAALLLGFIEITTRLTSLRWRYLFCMALWRLLTARRHSRSPIEPDRGRGKCSITSSPSLV